VTDWRKQQLSPTRPLDSKTARTSRITERRSASSRVISSAMTTKACGRLPKLPARLPRELDNEDFNTA